MRRVLQVQELLSSVFGFLDTKSRFACALTCKQWTGVALEKLWSELDSERPLASLLCPLKKYGSLYEFTRLLRFDDFDNFARYAQHVRELTVNPQKSSLADEVYNEIAARRIAIPLLPKLSRLKLLPGGSRNLDRYILFMSESVTSLHVQFGGDRSEAKRTSDFFREISRRMPNLEELSLRCNFHYEDIEVGIAGLISSLTKLKTFRCPINTTTSEIMGALSELPHLAVIAQGDMANFGLGLTPQVKDFHLDTAPGAFDALVRLEFSAKFVDAASFLKKDFARNLESLFIHSPCRETARQLRGLLQILSRYRSDLTTLRLDSVHQDSGILRVSEREADRVTTNTLVPLQTLCKLRSLHLAYHRMFQVNNSEFIDFVSSWPNLETLRFCSDPDPGLEEHPILTPTVLPLLAESCPKLVSLSLYLETRGRISLLAMQQINNDNKAVLFHSLREINFGTSPIRGKNALDFVIYVSQFLPRTCSTENLFGEGWASERPSRDSVPWKRISSEWKFVPFALKVQIASNALRQEGNRLLSLLKNRSPVGE